MAKKINFLELESKIVDMLKTIYDPEIPVSIYEMGLIYEVFVDEKYVAHIKMTLTSPNCPVAEDLSLEVRDKVKAIEGITDIDVILTFDPPWSQEMMTDAAKLELGLL